MTQPPYGNPTPRYPGERPYGQEPYGNPSPGYPGQQPYGSSTPSSPYGQPTPGYSGAPSFESPRPYPNQASHPDRDFQPDPPSRNRTPLLVGIIAGLVLVIAGLAIFVLLTMRDDDEPVVAETTAPTSQPTQAPAPDQPTTAQAPAPGPTVTVTQAPAPTTTTVTAPPPTTAAWPPPGSLACDSGQYVAVNDVTSCSFAYEVQYEYFRNGPGTYDVWSPVTEQYHSMTCGAQTANIVYCSGGTNAEVWFRQ